MKRTDSSDSSTKDKPQTTLLTMQKASTITGCVSSCTLRRRLPLQRPSITTHYLRRCKHNHDRAVGRLMNKQMTGAWLHGATGRWHGSMRRQSVLGTASHVRDQRRKPTTLIRSVDALASRLRRRSVSFDVVYRLSFSGHDKLWPANEMSCELEVPIASQVTADCRTSRREITMAVLSARWRRKIRNLYCNFE